MATPAIVQVVEVNGSSGSITVQTTGNTVICILDAVSAGSTAFTSIAWDGSTTAFTTDDAFRNINNGGAGKDYSFGTWSIASATSGSHTVALTMTNVTSPRLFLIEASGVGAFDAAQTSTTSFGNSATATTGSIVPSAANDLLLAAFITNQASATFCAYTNGFAQSSSSGTSPAVALASYVDPGTASINAGATISTSNYWCAYLVGFKAAGSTAYSLSAATGSYSLTGELATRDIGMPASEASFGLVGYASHALYGLPVAEGSFGLTGNAASLSYTSNIVSPIIHRRRRFFGLMVR